MALLERINQLKQQGYVDQQIIQYLQEEGISPKEINEALSQSTIKSAIAQPQEARAPSLAPAPGEQAIPVPDQQANGSEQYYDPNQYYDESQYAPQTMDIETIREISKQVTETQIDGIKKELEATSQLKSNLKFKLENLDQRLSKIESFMEQIQSDIIKKIGEYGEAISNISNEMTATQDTFSKMVNPILDKKRSTPKAVKKAPIQEEPEKDSRDSFDGFMR